MSFMFALWVLGAMSEANSVRLLAKLMLAMPSYSATFVPVHAWSRSLEVEGDRLWVCS